MNLKRWALTGLVCLVGLTAPASAGDYRLLSLNGSFVKWGKPAFGSGATITYAFATETMNFPGARNCAAMAPFNRLAAASGSTVQGLRREVRSAFEEWERVSGATFKEVLPPVESFHQFDKDTARRKRSDQ